MSVALTSDPIISEQDAKEILDLNKAGGSGVIARILINSVSEKFLKYTHRSHINQAASTTMTRRGDGKAVVWARAYINAATQVEFLSNGDVHNTLTFSGGDFTIYGDSPKIVLHGYTTPVSLDEENVRLTYTPGWPEIPGAVLSGAVEQVIYERERIGGRGVGVDTESRGDHSVTYETNSLLKAVREAWAPYVLMY